RAAAGTTCTPRMSRHVPAHTRLRAALTANLSPRALRGLKGRIAAKADALVAGEPYAWCSASTPC
ncbi:hypothetical protein GTW59_28465, partial [Streptomyces sp. SID89]|nr:hypothetical protein [Streptomyces sp. SID89]